LEPVVREQTLKSVLVVVPKLSDRVVNGELLRYLAKTANDEQPGIRTNTTICLGKMAKNLNNSTRSKVLIAAFTRSLRDPFVHARNASLMALGATNEYFSDEDCAGKILPVLCPLLVDKEKIIRDSANRAIDSYLQKVRKAAADMPDTVLPPAQASGTAAPRMGTPQASDGGGWTGWAISSFTNKLSAAAGDMQTANGSNPASPALTPGSGVESKKPTTASASSLHRQAVKSPSPQTSRGASPNPAAMAAAFLPPDNPEDTGDAWGDMGDDDGYFDAPTSSQPAPAAASATPFDDGNEPDFAGWLAARSQQKTGKPLPKGLSKSSALAKKPASKPASKPVVAKKIDMKPKEADDDDGWGDGW
jgi:SCY1-like protein 1